jgi:cobalamin biosynthesis Mg chelatase CobN
MFRKANETPGFDMQLYSLQLAEDPPDTLKALIRALEDRGMNVIPVFSYSMIDVLKRLGVPVFQPIVSLYRTAEEWEASSGLANDIGWSVAMPEFECVIEPVIIGAGTANGNYIERIPIPDRCDRLAKRVEKWISLAKKPVHERRVAFILQNNPCAGVEATVGAAGSLDSLESLSLILKSWSSSRKPAWRSRDGWRNGPETASSRAEPSTNKSRKVLLT